MQGAAGTHSSSTQPSGGGGQDRERVSGQGKLPRGRSLGPGM